MLGNILLGLLILIELVFMILSLLKKSNFKKEKSAARVALFAIFIILVISPIIDWSFRWIMPGLFLGVQAILGILALARKKENTTSKNGKIIFEFLNKTLLIILAMLPVLIFPQYSPIKYTGEYSVGTKSYTLTDESREEHFTKEKDNRKVSIQYWYPLDKSGQKKTIASGKFPLVVFSHGAFGYRMSNYSTYETLASHGYIVCSIDHTYHAFMTVQEDGKNVMANLEFVNNATKATNGEISAADIYKLQQEWMKLRTGDMAFILSYIKEMAGDANADSVYQSIDLEHIGVFGHSLGGATAAKIARDDKDVDAVCVIDGTMMGEIIGFEGGKELITDIPYPKPIMNIYNESHYDEALQNQGEYPNMVASKSASDSYQVVIRGSGHMNFTDLPLISPFLSRLLGIGSVNAKYCIETTNEVILQFFDRYLKSTDIEIPKEIFQ